MLLSSFALFQKTRPHRKKIQAHKTITPHRSYKEAWGLASWRSCRGRDLGKRRKKTALGDHQGEGKWEEPHQKHKLQVLLLIGKKGGSCREGESVREEMRGAKESTIDRLKV